jgi:hypothetical protein
VIVFDLFDHHFVRYCVCLWRNSFFIWVSELQVVVGATSSRIRNAVVLLSTRYLLSLLPIT